VVRTRQLLPAGKTDLVVTMQVKGYRTHVEALEALLNESRTKLTYAFEASENKGPTTRRPRKPRTSATITLQRRWLLLSGPLWPT
jgi:hypothetical protein